MTAFDRVIGYESVKEELIRYCDSFKNPERYRKLGVKAPRGVLLWGEPGIGKSLMAECFAEECGCKTYIIRKQYSDGKFLDYITDTFREACENAPAVIILDDLDKFSNSGFEYRNTDEYVAVQAGIDACKEYDVFVLATANDIGFLPYSLIRAERFDRVIELQDPSTADAKQILTSYIQKTNIDENVDIQELLVLLSGRTCAELEKVVNDAGISAAYAGRSKIGHVDLFNACVRLITGEPDTMDPCTGKSAKLIAIHEAGHVVVSEYWKSGSVNLASIAGTSCRKCGVTSFIKEDEKAQSMEDMIEEVSVMLGGKAATKVLLDIEDTGCRNDIRNAYNLAKTAVADLCWENFSTITYGPDASEQNMGNRDTIVSDFLDENYKVTKEIISENQILLQRIADALLAQTTITYKDIKRIINEVGWDSTNPEVLNRQRRCQVVMRQGHRKSSGKSGSYRKRSCFDLVDEFALAGKRAEFDGANAEATKNLMAINDILDKMQRDRILSGRV